MPLPRGGVEAERQRQLVAAKSGGDTDVAVVTADVIGPEQGSGDGVEQLGETAAGRLAGDDHANGIAQARAE